MRKNQQKNWAIHSCINFLSLSLAKTVSVSITFALNISWSSARYQAELLIAQMLSLSGLRTEHFLYIRTVHGSYS